MRTFLVAVVLLAGAAVAADRVALHLATGEAESRLAAGGLATPRVEVGGFPFLTQLLERRFGEVRVAGRELAVGGERAGDVRFTGTGVTVPAAGAPRVTDLRGRGVVTYDQVLRRAGLSGVSIEPAGDGRVTLRGEVSLLGSAVDVLVTGTVAARGSLLRVRPESVTLADGGSIEASLGGVLAERFAVTYRIRGLPEDVRVDRVAAGPRGFVVHVTGRDVVLPGDLASG